MLSMNRVAEHLEKQEGREDESKLLREFFTQQPIQQAIKSNSISHMNAKTTEPKPTTSTDLSSVITDYNDSKMLPVTRIQGDLKIVKVNKCNDTYLVSISFLFTSLSPSLPLSLSLIKFYFSFYKKKN
ncbi:unnamed protein product [Brugia pahangi]|uniref:Uncharacterized protein n=1 Tax=Brugia pahangi TaxID=6280 RepID=A0A0N4TEH5_BRUPA|nr:unnamed protein product [Brugia pahangi]